MGSRWFKILFVILVLFVARMAWKATLMKPKDIESSLSAVELFNKFQLDRIATVDKYAGARLTIDGVVLEVNGADKPVSLILADYHNQTERMVECYLSTRRNYSLDDFYPGQEVALQGRIKSDQNNGWVIMEHCRMLVY